MSFRYKDGEFMPRGCIRNASYCGRMRKSIRFMLRFAEDLLVLGGFMLIIGASYRINAVLGQYVLGVILLLLGFVVANK